MEYCDEMQGMYLISEEMVRKYRDENYSIARLMQNKGLGGKYVSCYIWLLFEVTKKKP